MSDKLTVQHRVTGMPVGTLRAEVLDGPDAGQARVAVSETLSIGSAQGNELVLTDPTVSRYHVELSRRADGILAVDCGSTNGTRVGSIRIERAVVAPGTILELGSTRLRVGEGDSVEVELHDTDTLGRLKGKTPAMRRLMARMERAAKTDKAVLLVGESGTGKELIARDLHELGSRAKGPLVTVDCGALSPTLVASELFGHEKGAFTGADRQHIGAFERATGGTIFLDEIGELPPALQATLLGVLERRKLRRLGGRDEVSIDVRVISATNRDLRAEVNSGAFRLDLYYRLAVVVVQVPALRERADDIPLLVETFLRECGHDGPVEQLVSPATMKALCAHRWPGNVRELRNLVEATVAMGETPSLDDSVGAPIPPGQAGDPMARLLGLTYKEARDVLLREFEGKYLAHLLERTRHNVSRAAREARMDRSHLIDLLRRHNLR